MKPNANFKLSSQSKRSLAAILDPHLRGKIKRSMIEAELAQNAPVRIIKNKNIEE